MCVGVCVSCSFVSLYRSRGSRTVARDVFVYCNKTQSLLFYIPWPGRGSLALWGDLSSSRVVSPWIHVVQLTVVVTPQAAMFAVVQLTVAAPPHAAAFAIVRLAVVVPQQAAALAVVVESSPAPDLGRNLIGETS